MIRIGRVLRILILSTLFFSGPALATLSASVDRDRVAMGDTLRLTITATGNERINNLDLRPLLTDFEILRRSTSSNTSINNGQRTSTRSVTLDITPRRQGTLRVPALRAGNDEGNYLLVSVSAAPNAVAGGQAVSFTASLNHNTVYVQGQVILTLRILQSINLESRSITDLEIDNAFVKPLEQKSFQRSIDGRQWIVHEIRYAIFPEESGTLTIPAQTFSARESSGRRSMFGMGSNGRQLRRTTEALSLKVSPRPKGFPGSTWLPASALEIQETWSTPADQLRVGESVTRTVKISGAGLQGAQLPPTLFPATNGLKYYPDQPLIGETETSSGLTGFREDSAALIPTRAGNWTMPEVRIPWWDTKSETVRFAVLPERHIVVAAGSTGLLDASPIEIIAQDTLPFPTDPVAPNVAVHSEPGIWKLLAVGSIIGWFCTVLYFLFFRSRATHTPEQKEVDNTSSEKESFKLLLAACTADNPLFSRKGIIEWSRALVPETGIHSLNEVSLLFNDADLSSSLTTLNNQLYNKMGASWDGSELLQIVKRLRKQKRGKNHESESPLSLYS